MNSLPLPPTTTPTASASAATAPSVTKAKPQPPRQVRLLPIALLMLAIAVLGAGSYFIRQWQIRRNASVLLVQADDAHEKKETRRELQYLQTYLGLVPSDTEARARYALLFADEAKNPRLREQAYYLVEGALRLLPERTDLRRKAIDLASALNQPEDAVFHLETLSKAANGQDVKLLLELAENETLRRRWKEAAQWYERATGVAPEQPAAYLAQARIVRNRLKDPKAADQLIARMVSTNPDSPALRVAQAEYLRETDLKSPEREEIRKRLVTMARANLARMPELVVMAARYEIDSGNLDDARALLTDGVKAHPKMLPMVQELVRLELRAGRNKEALALLRTVGGDLPTLNSDYLTTVELLLETGDKTEARRLIERVLRNEESAPVRDYLDARLAIAEERWLEASKLLQRAREARWLPPEFQQTIALSLARVQREMGNHDRELEAADSALDLNPGYLPSILARADALTALNRTTEALEIYQSLQNRVPDARLAAVSLRMNAMLRRPAAERDWKDIRAQLFEMPVSLRASVRFALTSARLELLSGNPKAALTVLQDAYTRHPREVELRILAAIAANDGTAKGTKAPRDILAEGEKEAGSHIDFVVFHARLDEQEGNAKAAQERLARAEKEAATQPEAEHMARLRGLAGYFLARGERERAQKLLEQVVAKKPNDLRSWRTLFELSTGASNPAQMENVTNALEKLEGDEGATWRLGRALLLANTGKGEDRTRALDWLKEAERRRPGWGKPSLLAGQIAEASGDREMAITQYKAALERGEVTPVVIARLVRLLSTQRKEGEIQNILARYRDLIPLSTELVGATANLALSDPSKAPIKIEELLKALPADSKESNVQLMRGQILWALKKLPEAEAALRQAVALDAKRPETHLALVSFIKEGLNKSPEAEIEAASRALPAETMLLTVANCRQITREFDKADQAYKTALAERPRDAATQRAVVSWWISRGKVNQAEPILQQLIEREASDSASAQWARRTLALATGATGDYEQYKKALSLIEQNARKGVLSPEDQRAKALIQARQPRDRREAVRNLEESFARVRPSASEAFFLATLQVANGEWNKAKVQFVELLSSREGQNPLFLAYYIEQLVVHNELAEARNFLSRLEKEEADSLRVVGLRARLLKASKQEAEARDSLSAFAQKLQKEPAKLLDVARLTDALGFAETAEPMYREAIAKSTDPNPSKVFPLIQHLGRRGKVTEALDLCEPLRAKVPPLYVAELAVNALRDGKGSPEQCKRVLGWVREFKTKAPAEVFYDLVLANIDDLLGDRKASIAGYRAALERDPRNLLALNNLGVLLALEARDFEEANRALDKALQIAGPDPGLLDSQGILLLAKGDYRKAAEVLDQAVRLTPDPATYARLAFAHAKLGEFRAARNALRLADQAGYQPTSLHPLERKPIEEELGKLRGS